MTQETAKIKTVRGWCWCDRNGHLYTDTFWDVPGEQGAAGCCSQAMKILDAADYLYGRPVPVELRPLDTAHRG
jgi:hypothetical protein